MQSAYTRYKSYFICILKERSEIKTTEVNQVCHGAKIYGFSATEREFCEMKNKKKKKYRVY